MDYFFHFIGIHDDVHFGVEAVAQPGKVGGVEGAVFLIHGVVGGVGVVGGEFGVLVEGGVEPGA